MRLFAAVPIPEPARGEVAKLLVRLREPGWPLRLVHDHGLHLTVKFFGEVPPGRLEVIEEAVRAAVPGTGALSLRLAEIGPSPISGDRESSGSGSRLRRRWSCCRTAWSGEPKR